MPCHECDRRSSVTTPLTAFDLYLVGTSAVKGFAITLLIGLGASMLSATLVTRTLFLLWLRRRRGQTDVKALATRAVPRLKFNVIGTRRWAYGVSGAFILPGLLLVAARGATYGNEFTGGAMMQVNTTTVVGSPASRSALHEAGLKAAEIQTFGSDSDYVIRARLERHNRRVTAGRPYAVDEWRVPGRRITPKDHH